MDALPPTPAPASASGTVAPTSSGVGAHHQWWVSSSTFNFTRRGPAPPVDGPEDLVLFDEFCSVCTLGGTLIVCDGVCRRAFHADCVAAPTTASSDDPYLCTPCSNARNAVLLQLECESGAGGRVDAAMRALMKAHVPREVRHGLERFTAMDASSSSNAARLEVDERASHLARALGAAVASLCAAVGSTAGVDEYTLLHVPLWCARLELLVALHAAHAAAASSPLRDALLRRFEAAVCAYNTDSFARFVDGIALPAVVQSTSRATHARSMVALLADRFMCACLCAMNVCERVGIAVSWKRSLTTAVSRACAPVPFADVMDAITSPVDAAGAALDAPALDAFYDAFLASACACVGADVDTHMHAYEHAMTPIRERASERTPATCARIIACASEQGAMPLAQAYVLRELAALDAACTPECACAAAECTCSPACSERACPQSPPVCPHTLTLLRCTAAYLSAFDVLAFSQQSTVPARPKPKRTVKGRKRGKRAVEASDALAAPAATEPAAADPAVAAAPPLSPFMEQRARLMSACTRTLMRVYQATGGVPAEQLLTSWPLHMQSLVSGALTDSYSGGVAVSACIRGFGPSQAYTSALFTRSETALAAVDELAQPQHQITSATLLRIRALYMKDSDFQMEVCTGSSLHMCDDALDDAWRDAEAGVHPPAAAGTKRGRPSLKKMRTKGKQRDDDGAGSDDDAEEVITQRARRAGAREVRPVIAAVSEASRSLACGGDALELQPPDVVPAAADAAGAAATAVQPLTQVPMEDAEPAVLAPDTVAAPAQVASDAPAVDVLTRNAVMAQAAAVPSSTLAPTAAAAPPTLLSSVLARLRGAPTLSPPAASAPPPAEAASAPPPVLAAPSAEDIAAAGARLKLSAHMRDRARFLEKYTPFLRSLAPAAAPRACSCEVDMHSMHAAGYILLCSRGEAPCSCACTCGKPRVRWTVAAHVHVHSMVTDDNSKQVLPLAAVHVHTAMMCGLTGAHTHTGALRRVAVRGGHLLLGDDAPLQLVCGCICQHACEEAYTSSPQLKAFVTTFTTRILAAQAKQPPSAPAPGAVVQ